MHVSGLTRTMVRDGTCRWWWFLLSPTLLGLGSGRFLSGWFASCLCFLALLAWLSTSLGASAAVVEVATVATLTGLLVGASLAALVLLGLFTVPHRSGTGWTTPGRLGEHDQILQLEQLEMRLHNVGLSLFSVTNSKTNIQLIYILRSPIHKWIVQLPLSCNFSKVTAETSTYLQWNQTKSTHVNGITICGSSCRSKLGCNKGSVVSTILHT